MKAIFDSAQERPPAERTSYLDEACGDDEAMRREVESLLTADESNKGFLSEPAYKFLAGMLAEEKLELEAGQDVGPYKILSVLGIGGMGQVYLAQDTRLGRRVALKLLPTFYTQHAGRLRRFEQEARTASALNHPNIVTIYEIGQADSTHFIATEFIDGITLRAHLAGKNVNAGEALSIAMQVASALAAAHAKGVVHRDIKPENIMVLEESYSLHRERHIKVLDFGIAKLTDPRRLETDAPTRPMISTGQGVLLGTACYMSPEQARGTRVDARTDIWSLGVVLYEMLAGGLPFAGDTAEDVRAAILKDKLPQLSTDIPDRLKWIVEKSLRKDPDERYQTIREMFSDLRELHQQEFVSEALREQSVSPEGSGSRTVASGGRPVSAPSVPASTGSTTEIAASATSSAEYIVSEIKRHKKAVTFAFIGLILIITAIGFASYRLTNLKRSNVKSAAPFQTMKIRRLTSNGKVAGAAISPDGRYVVHVVEDGARQSLWMRQVATASNIQIVPPADVQYEGLIFSRDGTYIYYVASEKGGLGVLYQMPVLGGAPRRLVTDIDSPVTFSPDGGQFAFGRGYPDQEEDALVVANADGTAERKLATRKTGGSWEPAWSPDGKVIASRAASAGAGSYMTVVEVRAGGGQISPITPGRWWQIGQMAWLSDGSGLIMTASEQESSPSQLWYLSYPGGESRRITNDLNDYVGLGLTADSTGLLAVQSESPSNVWIVSNGDVSHATQISFTKFDGLNGISWTPDGRLVYESRVSGHSDLWMMDADGNNQKQLTVDASNNGHPANSPEGRYIVFTSNRAGNNNIWRMDVDGRNLKQLTYGPGEQFPDCSPDGQWVVYNSFGSEKVALWKVPLDGGKAVQLTDNPSWWPIVSPDGKLIACDYWEEGWKVAIIPFDGGQPARTLDSSPPIPFHWTPDGHALAYLDRRNLSSIWSLSIDGGPAKLLTDFKSGRIFNFAWSHDGKNLAVARGDVTNDVVLITGFN